MRPQYKPHCITSPFGDVTIQIHPRASAAIYLPARSHYHPPMKTQSKRHDNRSPSQLRPLKVQRHFTKHAGGSVLISFGNTRVLCTAMIERDLPPWLRAKGPGAGGWLT